MVLEILHRALVLFRRRLAFERAEVAAFARLRIFLPRVEAIFS